MLMVRMFTCKLLVAGTKRNYVIRSRRTECASMARSVSSRTVYTNCETWPGIRSTRPSCVELFTRKDIALTEHAATSSTRNVTCPNRNRLPCACYPTLCPLLRWRICPCRRTACAVCRRPPVRTRSLSPRHQCVLHRLHQLKLDCPYSMRSAHPHCYPFTDNLAVWLPRGLRFSFFFPFFFLLHRQNPPRTSNNQRCFSLSLNSFWSIYIHCFSLSLSTFFFLYFPSFIFFIFPIFWTKSLITKANVFYVSNKFQRRSGILLMSVWKEKL